MACTGVIKMKHQGKCYMNVSANPPSLRVCFFLPLRTSPLVTVFLKYLQGKLGVDILPFHRHAARRRLFGGNFTAVVGNVARSNTGHGELFPALLILPERKGPLLMVRCHKMLSTALDFLKFQLPLDGLKCRVSLQGDMVDFSFSPLFLNLLFPIFTLDCISRVLLAQTSGALMAVSQKSSHQKAVSVV